MNSFDALCQQAPPTWGLVIHRKNSLLRDEMLLDIFPQLRGSFRLRFISKRHIHRWRQEIASISPVKTYSQ